MLKRYGHIRQVIASLAGLALLPSAFAAWQPGLKAGYLNSSWDTNTYPTVASVQPGPHAAKTQAKPPWADNRTWVYTGQIYLSGGTYHFAESIDDSSFMMIDGVTLLDDRVHNVITTSGDVALPAGWHDVEIRFGNGTGGAGPVAISGWTVDKGFGYNVNGADSTNGLDYVYPEDDGSMTMFRFDDGFTGIVNEPAADVTAASATLNGWLLATNLINAVSVYWGPADGGTDEAAWSNRADFAFPAVQGHYPTNVAVEAANTLTFYRYHMSNDTLEAWAESTASVLSGEVNVEAADAEATEGAAGDTGAFRVTRPVTATNGELTVYYTVSGTASNGVDYAALDGVAVIPAGAASVDVTVSPIEDVDWTEGDEGVTLTLAPGGYVIGSLGEAALTVHDSGASAEWAHRVPILFAGYAGSEDLTNFPALVTVGPSIGGFSYAGLLSGANADLRFTDDSMTRGLNYEVERWDTNGTSLLWVQVPRLTNNAAIWMHWGRAGRIAPPYTTNGAAWKDDYVCVWHFAETGGATLRDSVGSCDGDVLGGTDLSAGGSFGSGAAFDGVDDYVALTNLSQFAGLSAATVSGWANLDTLGTADVADSGLFGTASAGEPVLLWYNYTADIAGDKVYSFNVGNTGLWTNRANSASGVAKAQTWQQVAGVLNGRSRQLYVDGSLRASNVGGSSTTGGTSSGYLGKWEYGNFFYDGAMDEIRLARVARSANWLSAEYLNAVSNGVFQIIPGSAPSLTVSGDPASYGVPTPAYGMTELAAGQLVACSAPATVTVAPSERYVCSGYRFYTNLVDFVAAGAGNSCVCTNSGGADRLVWLWTRQFYVAFTNSGPGDVSNPGGWYEPGTPLASTALPAEGGQFIGWQDSLGRLPLGNAFETLGVTVSEPLTLTASFIPPFNFAGWPNRLAIRFTGYTHAETLTNFPVQVVLSNNLAGAFRYADMSSPADAGDLRFTAGDGETELFYDVEKWDTNGVSTVWVRVPLLASAQDKLYAYWGHPSVSAPPLYTTNGIAWAKGYVAVYHLAESAGPVKDSGPYGNALSVYNGVQQGAAGIAGPAARWPDGTNDWLQRPAAGSLDGMGQLTLQTWFYDEMNDTAARGLISKRVDSGNQRSYYFFKYQNRNLFFYVGSVGGEFTNTATSSNRWNFAAVTYDKTLSSSRMKAYLDGAFRSSRNDASGDVPTFSSALHVGILNANYGAAWKGKLDEVRIANAARSADWLWAEYMNTASNAVFQSYTVSPRGMFMMLQ